MLFEHKSYPEPLISFQLLRYMVRVWELVQRQGEKLEIIFSIVVYHGEAEWRIGRNFHDLLSVPGPFKNYVPDFQYFLCDLSEYDDVEIKGAILLRIGLLALKYIFHEDLIQHLPGILALFHQISVRDRALECREIFLRYLYGAGNKKLDKQDLKRVITTTLPEGGVFMSTIAQELIEEGRRLGLLDAIELGLDLRFGEEGLKEMSKIRRIKDIEILNAIRRAIKTVKTIDELCRIYRSL